MDDIMAIAKKYLGPIEEVEMFVDDGQTGVHIKSASKERDISKALVVLKNGKQFEVEEGTLLYEKLKDMAKLHFLMKDAFTYINPDMIAMFVDIDHQAVFVERLNNEYQEKEEHEKFIEEAKEQARKVFFEDEE